jgi:D-alanine-D-alanine ligase
VLATLRETASPPTACWDLRDVSRMDAVVDAARAGADPGGQRLSGLTDTSLLPTAAAAEGTDLGVLFARLVERAVARG